MKEFVVLSGKGGTGKSSLSAALATLASKIVVADCDVDAANLYIILQPENYREEVYISGQKAMINYDKCTSCGLCMEYCRFDAISEKEGKYIISSTACDGCQLCERVCPAQAISMKEHDKSRWYAGNILNGRMIHARLAPGEDNSGKLVNIVREQARLVAQEIDSELILIDGPPGIGCPAISSMTGADHIVLVTEPTQSGMHDLKRIAELAAQFQINSSVVINKYDLNTSISNKLEEWCKSMKIPVIGKIPFDKLIVDAMVNCQSIIDYAPDSEVSNEIKSIWNKIVSYGKERSF